MVRTAFAKLGLRTSIVLVCLLWVCGCASGNQLSDLQRQVQLQGEQIRQQGAQIQALRNSLSRAPAATPPPACDDTVMRHALTQGDRQSAQGNLQVAAGYYHDALTACPVSPQAQLKVAQIDERLGNRAAAIENYRRVAGGTDAALADTARQALARLGSP